MPPADPLSYDEIHAIQRRERSSRSLAKIPPDFYPRLSSYLAEARSELASESKKGASPRVLLLQGQFRNLEETAREIVMLRLRKVSEMSFTVAEGGSLNERVLTPEERSFAEGLSQLIGRARSSTLSEPVPPAPGGTPVREAEGAPPAGGGPADPAQAPPPTDATATPDSDAAGGKDATAQPAQPAQPAEPAQPAQLAQPAGPPPVATLRILADIPPFEGENQHVYRLRKEDIVALPRDIASILVRRKKAVEMESPA